MWITLGIITYILFWLLCIISYTIHYLTDTIRITSFSQVLYTINAGMDGAESSIGEAVLGFFEQYWLLLSIGTVVFLVYLHLCQKQRKLKKKGLPLFQERRTALMFNCSILAASLLTVSLFGYRVKEGYTVLGIGDFLANVNRVTDLYETSFVEPGDTQIAFPAQKRNLIHIVLESMESTYVTPELGGAYERNVIPELYKLAKAGTDFSAQGTTDLNGALVTENSGWTVAGLVAQSAGVPLNVGHETFRGNFTEDALFMPHLTTLGEILQTEGYKNYFMCGSEGLYAGRSNYYTQHGNYEILDYYEAINEKRIPSDYHEWWGFEDSKLMDWAKEKLTEISKNDQPFNFTLLTADTHFSGGYFCPDCPGGYKSQYESVIRCSDKRIGELISWIQQQDFYENTTIVLSGDHLSMDGLVGKQAGENYTRKTYFSIINGPKYEGRTREFCTLDIFPTIVESLGATIDGHRLGLGTCLYGDTPTLIEKMGLQALNSELTAYSKFYTEVIMSEDVKKVYVSTDPKPAEKEDQAKVNETPPADLYPESNLYNQNGWNDYDQMDYNTNYNPQPEQTVTPPAATQPDPSEPTVPETPVQPEPPVIETPEPVEPIVPDTPGTSEIGMMEEVGING